MLFTKDNRDIQYALLHETTANDVVDQEVDRSNADTPVGKSKRSQRLSFLQRILTLSLALGILALSAHLIISVRPGPTGCRHPRIRHEWRSLSKAQRQAYLDAAVCLTRTPSHREPLVTVHDDFSYLHSTIGNYSHDAAPFLPWHRYFIFAYEKALKDLCGYTGTLPYWDWSKDYRNVLESPIWDIDAGFGPNGDITGPEGVSNGHCVRNGSFAGWTPAYYQGVYQPHCLSRGFLDVATAEERSASTVKPEILQKVVVEETDYFNFTILIEDVSHITVPFLVHGDFRRITAPNDPVFFLHHSQIDRLWWSWQNCDADRFWQYNGPAHYRLSEEGVLTDMLEFGSILPNDPIIKDVMDTEGELCYRYDTSAVP